MWCALTKRVGIKTATCVDPQNVSRSEDRHADPNGIRLFNCSFVFFSFLSLFSHFLFHFNQSNCTILSSKYVRLFLYPTSFVVDTLY